MSVPKEIQERVEKLREEIRRYDYYYYVLNQPIISDAEYDKLFRELVELEEKYPELKTPDSPTQRVGAPPAEEFAPVEHAIPMLSLDNCFNDEELEEWDDRVRRMLGGEPVEYVCEPKLDGLSVELVYVDGVFTVGLNPGRWPSGRGCDAKFAHHKASTASPFPAQWESPEASRSPGRGVHGKGGLSPAE
jgi:DNA ligase (NAD+)